MGDAATEIEGNPVMAAPVVTAAAVVRNLRRETVLGVSVVSTFLSMMLPPWF